MRFVFAVICLVVMALYPGSPDAQEKNVRGPAVVYEEYNAMVVSGLSFEKEKTFFSKRKRSTLDQKIADMMARTGKTEQEVVELYQAVSEGTAQCREITLESKEIEGDTALLTYAQKDTCNPDNSPGPQKVRMVFEDGVWKIDDIVIDL